MIELHPLTRVVATHGLPDAGQTSPGPVEPDDWARLHREVTAHGLIGLLGAAVADGTIDLDDEATSAVADRHLTAALTALDVEAGALEAIDHLAAQGLPVRLLKGVASAHVDYPDPSWRSFNDADLLVRGDDIDSVVQVLTAAGYHRDLPQRRAGFDRHYGKDVTFTSPSGVQIDVHRTFAVGYFGAAQRPDDAWGNHCPFVLGGRTLVALGTEDRLLHACFAAVLGDRSPRAMLLRDIVQLTERDDLDLDLLRRRTRQWRCEAPVRVAMRLAVEVLAVRPHRPVIEWATSRPLRRAERALLALYPAFGGSHALASLSGVLGLQGPAKLAYGRGLLRPDASYRQARAVSGRRAEWRLLVAGLRRGGG